MRWEALFDDLEAQFAAIEIDERLDAVWELTRAERATVRLDPRLRAAVGRPLTLRLRSGDQLHGQLVEAAAEWLLLAEGPRRYVVPPHAIAAVRGLGSFVEPDTGTVARRLSLGHALRGLSRDRAAVRITVWGEHLRGRIEAVGADHLELVSLGEDGRGLADRWSVPLFAIDVVASA